MQTTITVPIKNAAQAAAILAIVGTEMATVATQAAAPTAGSLQKTAGKRGPKPAAAKAEPSIEEGFGEEETSTIDVSDLRETASDDPADFDGGEDFGAEEEIEEPKVVTPEELKGKLLPALNAYSKKNGKEKATKVLKQFAPSSKDVKQADLPKILKMLKV